MKKFVTLILAAALSASVLGCAGENKPATPPADKPAPTEKPAEGAAPAPEGGATPAPEGEKK
jgi:hypothetical protein